MFGPDLSYVDAPDYSVDPGASGAFYDYIRKFWPALPDWLADLDTREERVTVLPNDQGAVEKYILAASRAAREGAAA